MVSQDIQDLVTRIDALTAKVSVDEAAAIAKAVDVLNTQRAEDIQAVTDAVGRAENPVPAAGV